MSPRAVGTYTGERGGGPCPSQELPGQCLAEEPAYAKA